MSSPFLIKTPIRDRMQFFGRKKEKEEIFEALAAGTPQCVSIIGERRIGRSSLLINLMQTYADNGNLPNPHRYQFAYLDVSRDTCRTPDQFYAEVAQAMFGERYGSLSSGKFDDLLTDKNQLGQTYYVLLLDEFNKLQERREAFDNDFYDGLRARANAGELIIVLATHVPLDEIAIQSKFTSTFFGIFTPVELGNLSEQAAKRSVLRSATPQLTPDDFSRVGRWLEHLYHPLRLNLAAHVVWQARKRQEQVTDRLKGRYERQVAHVFAERVKAKRDVNKRRAHWRARRERWAEIFWRMGGETPYVMVGALLLIIITTIAGALIIFNLIPCVEWVDRALELLNIKLNSCPMSRQPDVYETLFA